MRFMVFAALLLASADARATRCPNILLVIDQSGSMGEDTSGGYGYPSKWLLMQQAVVGIVDKYGDQVPFGVELFKDNGGTDQECYAATKIHVEPAHDSKDAIKNLILTAKPSGTTNTGDAIQRAAVDPVMQDPSRGQYIVLITDGDPNCNSGEPTYSIQRIEAAAKRSPTIHTFVIGFDGSGGVNPKNLNNMAKAGLEPIPNCTGLSGSPCYYSASNAQKFSEAIDKVINQVVGGEFGSTMCDDSCYANGCPEGAVCVTDAKTQKTECVPDPCKGATCNTGDFCRDGQCVHACLAPCKSNEKCVDGKCLPNACSGVVCELGKVCDPYGKCIDNPCAAKPCRVPTLCDLASGHCIDDRCHLVHCPEGTVCVNNGNCVATALLGGADGGNSDGGFWGGSPRKVGCSISGRAARSALWGLGALFLIGLVLARRR